MAQGSSEPDNDSYTPAETIANDEKEDGSTLDTNSAETSQDSISQNGQTADPPTYVDTDSDRERTEGSVVGKVKDMVGGSVEYDATELYNRFRQVAARAQNVKSVYDNITLSSVDSVDDTEFFASQAGIEPLVTRYDLEKATPNDKKGYLLERERYWVNFPYAFISIIQSQKENEIKYYIIEPHLTTNEQRLREFLVNRVEVAIQYTQSDETRDYTRAEREHVIRQTTCELLNEYSLLRSDSTYLSEDSYIPDAVVENLPAERNIFRGKSVSDILATATIDSDARFESGVTGNLHWDGSVASGKPVQDHVVEKLLYYLTRDFIGYQRIDAIKYDTFVEDISCNGTNVPVFVYHGEYEQIVTNVKYTKSELTSFVRNLAEKTGKSISKREPQVDGTLPDDSRAQLTLGTSVSDRGTNYTIRQFKDVPFTPIDLINWNTISIDMMAFLWLAIENNKSMIVAGGTASGKTTTLNALSLFIPSGDKVVSIEDTRELNLPHENWIASVTRPSFDQDDTGEVDEFALLEAALRQRPDYIAMGEVRGEEGRTLFQVMSTGHTSYTTFHSDSVGEVIKRFTTEPINVSKTLFSSLDMIAIQRQVRVDGEKQRRLATLAEVREYISGPDEVGMTNRYTWDADSDTYSQSDRSYILDQIANDRGWSSSELNNALVKRKVVLSYLLLNDINEYTQVSAAIQAFINDTETTLALLARDELVDALDGFRDLESIDINISDEVEARVPRPPLSDEAAAYAESIMQKNAQLLAKWQEIETDALVEMTKGS